MSHIGRKLRNDRSRSPRTGHGRKLEDINVELLCETAGAILVTDDGGKHKHWLPKSQIETRPEEDGTITVTAPEWLLLEKGLL